MKPELQLEYACTNAEIREAQSLSLRRQFGGGAKWLSILVLLLILTGFLALIYVKIRNEVPLGNQPLTLAAIAAIVFLVFLWQNRSKKQKTEPAKVWVSEVGVTIFNGDSQVLIRWSGFSECLESPNLFVLLDRPKGMLVTFPKRAFPDDEAQDWFRTQANQRQIVAEATADAVSPCQVASGEGIKLSFILGYRDYLNRTLCSWRTKGMVLFVFVILAGSCLHMAMFPILGAVNSPSKVFFCICLPDFLIGHDGGCVGRFFLRVAL